MCFKLVIILTAFDYIPGSIRIQIPLLQRGLAPMFDKHWLSPIIMPWAIQSIKLSHIDQGLVPIIRQALIPTSRNILDFSS